MAFECSDFHPIRSRNFVECRDKFGLAVKIVNNLKAFAESSRRDDVKRQSKWIRIGKSSIIRTESLTDLEKSKETVRETEQIGLNIISGLRDDRDALLKARFRIVETDRSASEAREVLLLIDRRINVHVMLLTILISVLFLIILLLLYLKLEKKIY
jgi:Snare region anchored in the vesicle membrane C-terminus